jgi:hypothetical protein
VNVLDTPQGTCLFGLARRDVTPPVGIYHRAWGAATHDRAAGVHRPLTATALAFRDPAAPPSPASEQVVVALDLCLLWAPEMDALLEALARQTGLAPGQVVVAFSHTHAAGLLGRERAGLPGGDLIGPYLDRLAGQLGDAVREARASARPATLLFGAGRCSLAAHRDYWDEAAGQYVCGFNPDGPSDDTVLVCRAVDASGRTLATLVNYACHPTTLAWENTLLSPDFPGAMREVVEAATGAPCAFLQGASGDLGPREGYVGDPAVADRNGRQLGYAALAALEALPPPGTRCRYAGPVVSGATLGTWVHERLGDADRSARARWRCSRWEVPLPYRADLPTRESAVAEQARWRAEEEAARRAGDLSRARDCRALAERATRWLTRLEVLPAGPSFPLPAWLWQTGDALWLAVEAEHYNVLQRTLRARFPGVPLVVMTLANGSRATYLPAADAYGKGIYQESVAVLERGCLEELIGHLGGAVAAWLDDHA